MSLFKLIQANHVLTHCLRMALFVIVISSNVGCSTGSWRDASRESAHIAPDPRHMKDALIHVYAADAWGWRGFFAVHTWIAVKPKNADKYTVLEVVGWRTKRGLPALRIEADLPDRYWYGSRPELILEKSGAGTQVLIDKILSISKDYPWADTYDVFPGPNSNTYPAWVAENIPELGLKLPFRAIGSGFH